MGETHQLGLLAVRHAIENVSNQPITDAEIVAILRGAGGSGSQLRAAFGDVSLQAIAGAGASCGIRLDTILAAYRAAKQIAAAANPELDEALKGGW